MNNSTRCYTEIAPGLQQASCIQSNLSHSRIRAYISAVLMNFSRWTFQVIEALS